MDDMNAKLETIEDKLQAIEEYTKHPKRLITNANFVDCLCKLITIVRDQQTQIDELKARLYELSLGMFECNECKKIYPESALHPAFANVCNFCGKVIREAGRKEARPFA